MHRRECIDGAIVPTISDSHYRQASEANSRQPSRSLIETRTQAGARMDAPVGLSFWVLTLLLAGKGTSSTVTEPPPIEVSAHGLAGAETVAIVLNFSFCTYALATCAAETCPTSTP